MYPPQSLILWRMDNGCGHFGGEADGLYHRKIVAVAVVKKYAARRSMDGQGWIKMRQYKMVVGYFCMKLN